MKKRYINKFLPVIIIFLFNLIFFAEPIIKSLYLSPADWLLRFPTFSINGFHIVKNSLLADPVTQFQPWYKFTIETIKSGSFPLWNSLNAGGVPFFGNNISAVLFPLNFVFFLFNFKTALSVFYLLKSFSIGLFTYLYLREIKVSKYSALVGAVIFNFAGFNIVWLFWPHTNVVIFLPLILLLIEKISFRKNKMFYPILLSLSFAFAFFAGHPETFFHVIVISFLYFIFKLRQLEFVKDKYLLVFRYITAGLSGALLSSIQLIPFLEYLLNSYTLHERVSLNSPVFLPLQTVIYNILPNIGGSPSTPHYRSLVEGFNYNEVVAGYTGSIALFLAIAGIIFLFNKDRHVRFYTITTLLFIPFIYRISPISEFLGKIVGISANNRLLFFLAFSIAVVASKLLDKIDLLFRYRKLLLGLTGLLFIFTIAVNIFPEKYLLDFLKGINESKASSFITYQKTQISYLIVSLSAGILIIALLISKILKNVQSVFLILTVLVFMQTGVLLIGYNTSIAEKLFFPKIEGVENISKSGGKYITVGDENIIPADVNLMYGLNSALNYDALDIKNYKVLYKEVLETSENKYIFDNNINALNLFGIRYLLSYYDISKATYYNQPKADKISDSLFSVNSFEYPFKASKDNLIAIVLLPANFNRINKCEVKFVLNDSKDNRLFEKDFLCEEFYDKIPFQIDLPKIEDSEDRNYKILLTLKNGDNDNSIAFWQNNENVPFLISFYDEENRKIEKIYDGKYKIFINHSASQYRIVNTPLYYNEEQILKQVVEANLDFNKLVVLDEDEEVEIQLGGSENKNAKIETIKNTHTDIKFFVKTLETNSMFVTSNTYYPGWIAYIDGNPVKIYKVNYAFQGVVVPEGDHIIEFKYQPESLKLGMLLSGLGIVTLLLFKLIHYEK